MGAVSFSLDVKLVESLKEVLPFAVFVETGTFKGDTIAAMLPYFDELISVELSEVLWQESKDRFANEDNVKILCGNSSDRLQDVCLSLKQRSALYWLDAHWCVAQNTSGEQSQCPLLAEIKAINKLNDQSVILIDDARLFLATPSEPHEVTHWPNFNQVITALRALSSSHEIMVINDVILFYPETIHRTVEFYAKTYGIDWLRTRQLSTQSESLGLLLEEKEQVLQQQGQRLNDQLLQLRHKEQRLQEQARVIEVIFIIPGSKWVYRVLKRLYELFRPRLGYLNQFPPRPISVLSPCSLAHMAQWPRVSIVTPSFAQGAYIEKTINSVLSQDYPNLEYFVQDGGSTDETVKILEQYTEKLSGWESREDSGQSQAINLGFAKTTGEIMAWLNSDDLLLPGAMACVVDYFNRHPEVDVVYGNRLMIDEKGMEVGRWLLPGHSSKVLSWVDYIPQETMFWRRRIWEKAGGHVDESLRFAMDWDLLVRFREAGARFAHIPRFLGAFRVHVNQKTSATIDDIGFAEMGCIRERVLGYAPTRKQIRKAIIPFLLRHLFIDIKYRIKTKLFSFTKVDRNSRNPV